MHTPLRTLFIGLAIATLCCTASLSAQLLSGSIVGTVLDAHGAAIPAVKLQIISDSTGAVREVTSEERGSFAFNAVPPGTYTLVAEHGGFRKFQRKNINLEPNDHLSVGEIRLDVGTISEEVTVTAEGATVQTASSERSGITTYEQVQHLTVINRDFTFLASLQPGIVANTSGDSQGFRGGITFNANGGRTGQNNITVDGVPLENSNTNNTNTFISMDAISTVKIESSTFQAEFGRKSGAAIQAVTKSGALDYHGALYWYQRNEAFNASPFFNKAQGLKDPLYRYISAGANFGGPVYIPKLVKRGQKLFFFFNEEQQRELRPQDIQRLTMPTGPDTMSLGERNGDFSKTVIPIIDPKTGKQFPGNIIPTCPSPTNSCINPLGQKYLNLFPLPNTSGKNYNFQFQESNQVPKHNEVARVDYILSPKTTIYGVFSYWSEEEKGNNVPAGSTKWGWLPATYAPKSSTLNLAGTHSFSPTLFLEVSMAGSRWTEAAHPQQQFLDAKNRSLKGITLPQLHPEINPLNLLPQSSFGGITNPPNVTYDGRFPIRGVENVLTWTGTVTKVHGPHTAKAGVFIEHWRQVKGENGNFTGTYDFAGNGSGFAAANGNSGNAFANALLGNFFSYTESTTRPPLIGRYNGVEWFVQDNWKVTRNLVLDLGLRFGWSQPFHSPDLNEAGFVRQLFDPSKAVRLIQPSTSATNCGSFGSGCGRDPATGQTFPKFAIGAFVPNSGDPLDGTVDRVLNPSYPQGLRDNSGVKLAPRFGFAYDPFAKGNTVIRGGFGMFYDFRERDNFYVNISKTPPLQLNPVIQFQNFGTLPSAGSFIFPSDTLGLERRRPLPYVMEFSLGIQQNIGFKTVADIAYVGNLGRHLLWKRNANAIPFGTAPPTGALASQFYRSYIGYGNIPYSEYAGTSNYHSLQVAVNRRFTKSLQFGVAWTWSKAMDFVDSENDQVSGLIDPRVWNYGKAGFDHTHILKASFTWEVPKASRIWNNGFARAVLDDWTVSGIPTFQSGAPLGIIFDSAVFTDPKTRKQSTLNAGAWSGAPSESGRIDGVRVVVLHNPILPKDQRSTGRYFDTSAFAVPALGTTGNASKYVFRGPGINNWDLALFKNIPLRGERLHLQFRAEAYNAFNHTQFSDTAGTSTTPGGVDTHAKFDANGKQINPSFGQITAARANRRMQLALRLAF